MAKCQCILYNQNQPSKKEKSFKNLIFAPLLHPIQDGFVR